MNGGMENPPEVVLVARARGGSRDAFMELARRLQPKVYAVIYGMTRNREDAADLTQETFLSAFRTLGDFHGKSGFYTWLYRIAVNRTLNFIKKNSREKGRAEFDEARPAPEPGKAILGSPEGGSLNKELGRRLDEAIAELRPVYRAAFNLVAVQGMSHGEAARVLGCSENTVSWRMHKARKTLQARLKPYLCEGEDET
jgi:RNA polymerase sigma-70 factor (ECF subfamily)